MSKTERTFLVELTADDVARLKRVMRNDAALIAKLDAALAARPAYLIRMDGQGDCEVKVVDQATWDWVTSTESGRPSWNPSRWVDVMAPDEQRARYALVNGDGEEIQITAGSWENDRAIFATSVPELDHDVIVGAHFSTEAEATAAARAKGFYIAGTWSGCLY